MTEHPTPAVTLTPSQLAHLCELFDDLQRQIGTEVAEADTITDLEVAIQRAQGLPALWRACDTGQLPTGDPAVRVLLERERDWELDGLRDDLRDVDRAVADADPENEAMARHRVLQMRARVDAVDELLAAVR